MKKLNNYREDCEQLSETNKQLVLRRIKLEELLCRAEYENQQLRFKCENKDTIEQKVKMLKLKLSESISTSGEFQREIHRLRKSEFESQVESENDENRISKLIIANEELVFCAKCFATTREIFDQERAEFGEQIKTLENDKSLLDVEFNSLRQQLTNQKQSEELMRIELEQRPGNEFNFFKDFLKYFAASLLFELFLKLINYI